MQSQRYVLQRLLRNSSYDAAEHAWNTLSQMEQSMYNLSAKSTIDTIFALEPNIIEQNSDNQSSDNIVTYWL